MKQFKTMSMSVQAAAIAVASGIGLFACMPANAGRIEFVVHVTEKLLGKSITAKLANGAGWAISGFEVVGYLSGHAVPYDIRMSQELAVEISSAIAQGKTTHIARFCKSYDDKHFFAPAKADCLGKDNDQGLMTIKLQQPK